MTTPHNSAAEVQHQKRVKERHTHTDSKREIKRERETEGKKPQSTERAS